MKTVDLNFKLEMVIRKTPCLLLQIRNSKAVLLIKMEDNNPRLT